MSRAKISNLKTLRVALAEKEMTVTDLAKHIKRSRQSIYFALERPSRFPETYARIQEVFAA